MFSSGNGTPQQCAYNLIRTVKGEVPMERAKGLDGALIDTPATNATAIRADVDFLLMHYEPRIDVRKVELEDLGIHLGDFLITADFTDGEGHNGG